MSTARKGFTLIELLLVIGIIAILASIVILAINPAKLPGNTSDAQRRSDVHTILNAVFSYVVDNDGSLPKGISTVRKEICASASGTACGNPAATIDLDVLTGSFLLKLPRDPALPATSSGTQYFIVKDANGHITIDAPRAEGEAISEER